MLPQWSDERDPGFAQPLDSLAESRIGIVVNGLAHAFDRGDRLFD